MRPARKTSVTITKKDAIRAIVYGSTARSIYREKYAQNLKREFSAHSVYLFSGERGSEWGDR